MRKLISIALAGSVLATSSAWATVQMLPTDTPLFIQYVNAEQYSASNAINGLGNRGIVQITSIAAGTALNPQGSDIQGGGGQIFVDGVGFLSAIDVGDQILGVFHGITNIAPGGSGARSSGGYMDLYYWSNGNVLQNTGTELNNAANLAKFSTTAMSDDSYTGFTCTGGNTAQCTFLARFTFETGANAGDTAATISSPQNPSQADGTSKSYLSVDTSTPGLWTAALDSNFFTLDPCNNPVGHNYAAAEVCPTTGSPITAAGGVSFTRAQDVRLDNNFSRNGATAWDGGGDIIGLRSNDPARAYAVPEPASLALLGASLVGFGALRRRRKV